MLSAHNFFIANGGVVIFQIYSVAKNTKNSFAIEAMKEQRRSG
jgi:hypothetical protein